MRVARILRKLVRSCRPSHQRRAQCVFDVVDALVRCKRLTITSIGRAIRSSAAAKHNIKRVDRLIGNGRLVREKSIWYAAIASRLIGNVKRPLVLIDWTGANGFYTLAATVPAWGRSIPVYAETHPRSKYNNRKVHESFLRSLKQILPSRCTPILVADAGFQGPFWNVVHELHWGFVVRVRGTQRIIKGTRYVELLHDATSRPTELGIWSPKDCSSPWRLVRGPKPKRKRAAGRRTSNADAYKKASTEAWILVTNERQASTDQVIAAYAKRMQIEEAFRDIKSPRFGWGFSYASSDNDKRIDAFFLSPRSPPWSRPLQASLPRIVDSKNGFKQTPPRGASYRSSRSGSSCLRGVRIFDSNWPNSSTHFDKHYEQASARNPIASSSTSAPSETDICGDPTEDAPT